VTVLARHLDDLHSGIGREEPLLPHTIPIGPVFQRETLGLLVDEAGLVLEIIPPVQLKTLYRRSCWPDLFTPTVIVGFIVKPVVNCLKISQNIFLSFHNLNFLRLQNNFCVFRRGVVLMFSSFDVKNFLTSGFPMFSRSMLSILIRVRKSALMIRPPHHLETVTL
jgi:hypothetical protein